MENKQYYVIIGPRSTGKETADKIIEEVFRKHFVPEFAQMEVEKMNTLDIIKTQNEHKTNNFVDKGEDTQVSFREAAMDMIDSLVWKTIAEEPKRLRMREEEHKRKQEEEDRRQAELEKQRALERANRFVIYDDVDRDGDGSYVYFDKKNKQIVVDIGTECGYSGGTWFMNLDELKKHIAEFEHYMELDTHTKGN